MGLEDFITEPTRVGKKDKHTEAELCPGCGEEGKHLRNNEWKCRADSCDTFTWLHTDFELEIDIHES